MMHPPFINHNNHDTDDDDDDDDDDAVNENRWSSFGVSATLYGCGTC